MANIKFSQFTQKTTLGTVDFLVGYTGADNVQIDPADLLSDYSQGTGAAGQVTFFSAASTVTGDNDFYWDNTNKRLGIGTTTPGYSLEVRGTADQSLYLAKTATTYLRATAGINAELFTGGSMVLGSGNTERIRIVSTGNVGISTATPVAKLHVDGTLIATGISQLGSGGSNVYLTSSSAGNVGIGTSSPSEKLQINNGRLRFLESGQRQYNIGIVSGTSDFAITDATFSSERMRINSSGNVGIGTSTPAEKLDVLGKVRSTHDANNYMQLESNSGGGVLSGKSSGTVTTIVRTYGDSYFNGGNFGIGTSGPSYKLDVRKNQAGYTYIASDNANTAASGTGSGFAMTEGGSVAWYLRNERDGSGKFNIGNSANRLTIDSSGNVGIGTTTPAQMLHLEKADNPMILISRGNSNRVLLGDTGSNNGGDLLLYDSSGSNTVRIRTGSISYLNGGNVGIGTVSPVVKLQVNGIGYFEGGTSPDFGSGSVSDAGVIINENDFIYTKDGTALRKLIGKFSSDIIQIGESGTSLIDEIRLKPGNNGFTSFYDDNTETARFTDGKLGIGTTSPSAKLDISNGTNSLLTLGEDSGRGVLRLYRNTASAYLQAWHDGTNGSISTTAGSIILSPSSSNVGIGTSSPLANLTVTTSMSSSPTSTLYLDVEGTNTNGGGSQIVFNTSATSGTLTNYNAKITGTRVFGTGGDSELGFWTTLVSDNVAAQQRMVITKEGNVGIGTTSPSEKLEVNGNSTFTGSVNISGFIYHVGDTDSYFGFGANNVFDLATGGTRKLYADNSGLYIYYNGSQKLKTTSTGVTVTGDLEIANSSDGIILESPDGTRYRVTVANGGTLSVSAV